MKYWRAYKPSKNTFGEWKNSCGSVAEQLEIQKKCREVMGRLKEIQRDWYEMENPKEKYDSLYSQHFRVHKRKGHEIHEFIC